MKRHHEVHRTGRTVWLRAAVLGADDAIVSTASLMIGVAASSASKEAILVAGVAGLVAGSMSMAVGEYVSVSSQRDSEKADIERETRELESQPRAELNELAMIYVERGVERELAMKVAQQISARSARRTHAGRTRHQPEIPRAPDASGVDIGRKLRVVRGGSDCGSSRRASPLTHSHDRSRVPHEPGCPRRLWRASRWRAARSCSITGHLRRGSGDGGDRRHRAACRCFSGLK